MNFNTPAVLATMSTISGYVANAMPTNHTSTPSIVEGGGWADDDDNYGAINAGRPVNAA